MGNNICVVCDAILPYTPMGAKLEYCEWKISGAGGTQALMPTASSPAQAGRRKRSNDVGRRYPDTGKQSIFHQSDRLQRFGQILQRS